MPMHIGPDHEGSTTRFGPIQKIEVAGECRQGSFSDDFIRRRLPKANRVPRRPGCPAATLINGNTTSVFEEGDGNDAQRIDV